MKWHTVKVTVTQDVRVIAENNTDARNRAESLVLTELLGTEDQILADSNIKTENAEEQDNHSNR
tara:strand:- start:31 stop:222 length:192 start_codon:yes stop_codon:yes gene_type:complete